MEQQIHHIVNAVIHDVHMEDSSRLEWTPEAKMQMTKLILTQAATLGSDLEAFAKYHFHRSTILIRFYRHGKRSTVQPDDIRLALRRNPHLMERFHEFAQNLVLSKPSKKTKTDDKPTTVPVPLPPT